MNSDPAVPVPLDHAVRELPERENRVLQLLYTGRYDYDSIARQLGIERAEVARIIREARARLVAITRGDFGQLGETTETNQQRIET